MGKVYLIGAGPGEFELITVKGLKILQQCDAVLYDRLVSDAFIRCLKPACKLIYVGKETGAHSKSQEEINQLLVDTANAYGNVARLKGGDPFVFGRGGEEIEALVNHHIPYEVIPGVSSAIAALSSAGIPITHRGLSQSFHVICGHTSDTADHLTEDYEQLAKLKGTLVFLMGLGRIALITHRLMAYGMAADTPAAVISKGTMKGAKVIRGQLQTIGALVKESGLEPPATIVIGQTAHCEMVWDDESQNLTPLKDVHVGVIGSEQIREKLGKKLTEEGAFAHTLMKMEIIRSTEIQELMDILDNIKCFHWIAFTSQNGVRTFFQWFKEQAFDIRHIAHLQFAVIGSGTRDCLYEYGIKADLVANIHTAKGLACELSRVMKPTERVIIPRAKQGSKVLLEILENANIDYVEIPIYDVIATESTENHYCEEELDWCIFCSTSGVHSYYQGRDTLEEQDILEEEDILQDKDIIQEQHYDKKKECKIACIGEITATALRQYGIEADIVASISTVEEIVERIKEYEEIKGRNKRKK